MITKSGVLTTIEKNQNKIRGFGVKRLAVFGSFTRNSQKTNRDVDVLVEFKKGKKISLQIRCRGLFFEVK